MEYWNGRKLHEMEEVEMSEAHLTDYRLCRERLREAL